MGSEELLQASVSGIVLTRHVEDIECVKIDAEVDFLINRKHFE